MCGLCGAIVPQQDYRRGRLDAALATLRHRGPNHSELLTIQAGNNVVCLGHSRLSVIDLSDEANQPMRSRDGRFALIFNGEIYNYIELRNELIRLGLRFETTSDTEVLLQAWLAWGEACLERLDGMFAFAVYDAQANKLTCVRDAFGIKPFYYAKHHDSFYFASEIPAILDLLPGVPRPDLQRSYDYLVGGDYDSNERTFVESVRHLLPGHVMRIDAVTGKLESLKPWWAPPLEHTSSLSFSQAAETIREQFIQNVRLQLRSDVALGVALSGGVDSSSVVCAVRSIEPELPIHTFSFVAEDPRISEEKWVDIVNSEVGAIPHKTYVVGGDWVRDMGDMILAQGEPFGSTSIYAQYRVFRLARECGITVTLDGQGADELFAGYFGYAGYRVMSLWSSGQPLRAWRFLKRWREWPGRSYSRVAMDVARLNTSDRVYKVLRTILGRSYTPPWLNMNLLVSAGVALHKQRLPLDKRYRRRRVVERLAASLETCNLPALLRHGDRNSMRFSIESRVPFLTKALCELAYSLPEEYLISDAGETKSVFRSAMRGIVPDAILDRRDKVGFESPQHRWLVESADTIRPWLRAADQVPYLNSKQLMLGFDAFVAGRRGLSQQVWRWINYIHWYDRVLCRNA